MNQNITTFLLNTKINGIFRRNNKRKARVEIFELHAFKTNDHIAHIYPKDIPSLIVILLLLRY